MRMRKDELRDAKVDCCLKNPKESPSGFNPTGRALAKDYKPAPEEASMVAIEKALSFHNCTWRFLVDLDGPHMRRCAPKLFFSGELICV